MTTFVRDLRLIHFKLDSTSDQLKNVYNITASGYRMKHLTIFSNIAHVYACMDFMRI